MIRTPRHPLRWVAASALVVFALLAAPMAYSLSSNGAARGSANTSDGSATFSISGRAAGPVWPGNLQPMNLKFTNNTDKTLTIRHIHVTLRSVTAPQADADHPCTPSDFHVKQAAANTVITVAPNSSKRLKQAGFPGRKWPAVGLYDLSTNQDGCKGATFALGYSAKGRS